MGTITWPLVVTVAAPPPVNELLALGSQDDATRAITWPLEVTDAAHHLCNNSWHEKH